MPPRSASPRPFGKRAFAPIFRSDPVFVLGRAAIVVPGVMRPN